MNRHGPRQPVGALIGVLLSAVIICVGCDSQETAPKRQPIQEPLPVGTTQTAHEDDVIAPLYSHDNATASTGSNARTAASQGGDIKTPPTRVEADESSADSETARAERSTDGETKPSETTASDPKRRTSMPQRRGSTSAAVKGGVRKALPVPQAASPLFGKWTIDAERSSKRFVDAEAILFLADGRMRVWRGGAPEDGRWTWDSSDGVKTGGIDGVPFTLGAFEQLAGEITITRSNEGETQSLVLQPDRLFVAPPPVTSAAVGGPR